MEKRNVWNNSNSQIKSFYFDFMVNDQDLFSSLVLDKLAIGNSYSVLVRVELPEGGYRMLGSQIGFRLDEHKLDEIINSLYFKIQESLIDFLQRYDVDSLNSIQILVVNISLFPQLLLTNINNINMSHKGVNVKEIKQKYNYRFLPLTVNTEYFGKLITSDDCLKFINLINEQKEILGKSVLSLNDFDNMYLYNNNYIILSKSIEYNTYSRDIYDLKLCSLEGSFIDVVYDNENFKRSYKNISFLIKNSDVSSMTISNTLPTIKYNYGKSDKTLVSNPYIGTFDLEIYESEEGLGKVYAAGFCVKNGDPVMFYLEDSSYNNVLIDCIDAMLCNKYNGYMFYVHNLSYDGVFLIHSLKLVNELKGYDYYNIKPLYRDSKLLKVELSIEVPKKVSKLDNNFNEVKFKKIKIVFADSASLLNASLRRLCDAFGVSQDTVKGYFPYSFVKSDTLNYVGITPDFNHWSDISLEKYNTLIRNDWNLKDECLKYLSKDLTSLLTIMNLFNQYIARKFDVQIVDCLTISRLSLNIFLKKYLKESKIPIVKGSVYTDIKNAYFGGVTEVYKPYGKDLYYYDVNSLYPLAALNPMCGNKYTYLESYKEELNIDDLFGFFYCEIEASDNYLGLLPVKTEVGLTMPVGKWSGWYFSESLKFAKDNGYKIKVLKGYNFVKELNVFDDYVNTLYEIKSTTKNLVEKAVAKSLLNNLLGRFGLNIDKPITEIVNKEKLDLVLTTRNINSFRKITDNSYLISYISQISKSVCESYGYDYIKILEELKPLIESEGEFKDVSLVISAAVTSYAMIYMSKIKLDILSKGGNIYYTDTDSIITDIPLRDNLIGKDLGQFKLEYKIKEAYFISNKTYCLVLQEGSFNKMDESIIEDNSTDKTEWIIIKAKGLINKSLTLKDFIDLYNGKDVTGVKRSAVRTLDKGSVVIKDSDIKIHYNSYKKRTKIYDINNKWINTKPLNINSNYLPNDLSDKKKENKKTILSAYFIIKPIKFLTIRLLQIFVVLFMIILVGELIDVNSSNVYNNDFYKVKSKYSSIKAVKFDYNKPSLSKFLETNEFRPRVKFEPNNTNDNPIRKAMDIVNEIENLVIDINLKDELASSSRNETKNLVRFVDSDLKNIIKDIKDTTVAMKDTTAAMKDLDDKLKKFNNQIISKKD